MSFMTFQLRSKVILNFALVPLNTKESAIRSMKPNGFNGYFSGMPLWRTWMQDFSNPLSVKWRFTVKVKIHLKNGQIFERSIAL